MNEKTPDDKTSPGAALPAPDAGKEETSVERLNRLGKLDRPFERAGNFGAFLRGRLVTSRLYKASLVHAAFSAVFLILGPMLASLSAGDFVLTYHGVTVGDVRSLAAVLVPFSALAAPLAVYGSLRLSTMTHPVCTIGWMNVLMSVELAVSPFTFTLAFLEASFTSSSYARGVYVTGGMAAMGLFCAVFYILRFRQICGQYERTTCCVWENPYPVPSDETFTSGVHYRDDFYQVLKVKAEEEFKGREDGMSLEILITKGVPDKDGHFPDDQNITTTAE